MAIATRQYNTILQRISFYRHTLVFFQYKHRENAQQTFFNFFGKIFGIMKVVYTFAKVVF
jgi:hypothetical protein